MILIFILFILGFLLITKGADLFINSTVEIGRRTNISELILGATIVSFATTLPEFTVSLLASINGYTTISFGNAIGSIICNTGLILGLVAFISPFKIDKKMFVSKSIMLLVSVFVLIILSVDRQISRLDSIPLLVMLGIYMYTNYMGIEDKELNKKIRREDSTLFGWLKILLLFIVGLIMMVLGSKLLVDNGVKIATVLGIPQGIISLTVIALGTSLPELVSSLTAIRKNHHAISVGNILGANTLNIVSVTGAAAIPNSIPVLSQNMMIDFPFMIILLIVLMIPTIKTNKLKRLQGLTMLSIYIVYIIVLYFTYMA